MGLHTVPAAEDCCRFFESNKLAHIRLLYSGHNISVTYEERTGTTLATVLSQFSIHSVAISLKKQHRYLKTTTFGNLPVFGNGNKPTTSEDSQAPLKYLHTHIIISTCQDCVRNCAMTNSGNYESEQLKAISHLESASNFLVLGSIVSQNISEK